MITSVPQHDIFLVYPVLCLLSDEALVWLPPSEMTHLLHDHKFCKSLRSEIRTSAPSYDAYSARISGLTVKQHFRPSTRSSSISSSAPSTPSDAQPERFPDAFAARSPGIILAEDIESLSETLGQTHLEAATYLNWANYDQPLPDGGQRDPLSHVRLRMRRVTETAYGTLTSKVYELDLWDWHHARGIAAMHNHTSWWDSMDRQMWRGSMGVFIEVTRRFAHQGVFEPSPIWNESKWPSHPIGFLPSIDDPVELQRQYGIVGRLQDPKNAKMKLYIEHKSRDCRPEAKQRDCIMLPLLREAAAPIDVDGNWVQAYAHVRNIVEELEYQQGKTVRAEDSLTVLSPCIEQWLVAREQVLRQQRELESCLNGHIYDDFAAGNGNSIYQELMKKLSRAGASVPDYASATAPSVTTESETERRSLERIWPSS